MGRKFRYEQIAGPDVPVDGFTGITGAPIRFLPQGLTLFVDAASSAGGGGSYEIRLSPDPDASGPFTTYVDPETGLSAFAVTVRRAFRIPPCAEVFILRSGGGSGDLLWAIGGVTYTPYP